MARPGELDPASILRSIADDTESAKRFLTPDARLLFLVWGFAWIVGFLAMYLAFVPEAQPILPLPLAMGIGVVSLLVGIWVSSAHVTRRATGSRGPSRLQGAIYGNTYAVAFTMMGLLGGRLASDGLSLVTLLPYWVAVPCLIVGVLGLVGSALWNDRSQLVFGSWTIIAGLLSIVLPAPHLLLAGVIGGVGYLALAGIAAVRPNLVAGDLHRAPDA
ncbi:hypothetical protein [Microbacterium amylolyticum]|uniref:Uncharacterized protein n=1 Tax=Microbacterium amylolyticum TaxID=936337 RepID=A0ABS4ZHV2_9MICO|nr:hypothetical protein [Microbacterium amylolyticum]MBP2436066.1 hypothetical protein [Microbacterium amylolyticum]